MGNRPTRISLDETQAKSVDTATAAEYLNRSPQTLRTWACKGIGPITPKRNFGRLTWSVADIRAVVANGWASRA